MKNQWQALLKAFGRRREANPADDAAIRAILATGLFDLQWYLAQRPGLPTSEAVALDHYLEAGWRDGLDPSPRFSTLGYLAANPEVLSSGMSPLQHYFRIGRLQGRLPGIDKDGTSLKAIAETVGREFNEKFYREKYPDVARMGFSPLAHFLNRGWNEGRDPTRDFSTRYYLASNQDVREAGVNPYYHYLVEGRREGRSPTEAAASDPELVAARAIVAREFDAAYYLFTYPDVRESGVDALTHYLETGWRERRNPNADFSTAFYLDEHRDVASAGVDPFLHYVTEGRREGRATASARTDTSDEHVRNVVAQEFDSDFYLAQYSDVVRAGIDPLTHYLKYGWREDRDPCAKFSTRYYLGAYPDIREAGVNPFYHFIVAGRSEGRRPVHPGGWKARVLERLEPIERRRMSELAPFELPSDPTPVTEALTAALVRRDARFVLSISHDNYTESVGGVQLCIKLEEDAARARDWHYVNLFPARPLSLLSSTMLLEGTAVGVVLDGQFLGTARGSDLATVLRSARDAGALGDLVVHSLLGHSPESLVELHDAVAPHQALFWLHDFFSVCPSYTLLRNDVTYCGAPPADSSACRVCVYGDERREQSARLRHAFERISFDVVSPSAVTRDLWLKSVDLPYRSISIHGHNTILWHQDAEPAPSDAPLRLAFIGHPSSHKGWQTFLRVVDSFAADPAWELHHFGAGPRQLAKADFTRVSVIHDGPAAMQEALTARQIDVVLLWSIWPETFSFVAHEAMAAGAAIFTCPESGNIAHLVRTSGVGRVFDNEDKLIEGLASDELRDELLTRRQHGVRRGKPVFGRISLDLLASGAAAS